VTGIDNQAIGSAAPVLVNWSSTAFNGSATWLANCLDAVDHTITRLTRSPDPEDQPDLGLMSRVNYVTLKAKIRSSNSQQVVLVDTAGRSPNVGQYADRMIPYNGVDFSFDTDITGNAVHILNTKQMKFKMYPQKSLAGTGDGPIKGDVTDMFRVAQMPDIDQGGWKVVTTMCAQLICNPYYQGVLYNFA
jgi:hypothetical protein